MSAPEVERGEILRQWRSLTGNTLVNLDDLHPDNVCHLFEMAIAIAGEYADTFMTIFNRDHVLNGLSRSKIEWGDPELCLLSRAFIVGKFDGQNGCSYLCVTLYIPGEQPGWAKIDFNAESNTAQIRLVTRNEACAFISGNLAAVVTRLDSYILPLLKTCHEELRLKAQRFANDIDRFSAILERISYRSEGDDIPF